MNFFKKVVKAATAPMYLPFNAAKNVVSGQFFKDPLGATINPIADMVKTQAAVPLDIARTSTDALGLTEPSEVRKARQAEEARIAEETTKSELYNTATQDNTLDDISRREILALYSSGANSGKIASLLASAREGRGIYAVRKINQAQQKQRQQMPGRAQTLGTGTLL